MKEASQKCLECAALVERHLLSYLTLLCNTWCIPPQACTLTLSSFYYFYRLRTSLVAIYFCFPSLSYISWLCARFVLLSRPPSIFSPVLSHACRLPLSRVVIPGLSSHWLFLRLPKPMPVHDWLSRVGLGHAGSMSMWEAGKHMVQQTSGLGG